MNRYFIKVYGRVQGVGFRFNTEYLADHFSLTGWVKNCDDGTVEIEAQGQEDDIEAFKIKIQQGNRFIKVKDVYLKKIDVLYEEKSFRIIY
ncbi:acylphosphatase [Clostridium pasteurianum DSM 525 = ATCC 6013]|uniref:Acylphosphatase n=1 Tax=Clostridium pasteurianum DSM 525 = ATCC 6013 TaxID=1262449 RepID=A0A0H3J8K0_CLOPA|nr:acylphosphatase [Clostridium pasteurianum]AJA48268.1 acylphosphatase [Clostridium pasteurianum DSM 525 = ATCC 6013]AJA52256.1 acylphosphatase [Clostridium pasteurianum DSM 525 = ATCC 6013]AOZ75522.1 acylphosphatase [Clostridium pasteurianum DSM 525 = ATCC 6013]AOZ79317.1 acylphosphatase [Clostridium pasteurianum]ELP60582.1 Acylphosphatase, ACYP [Clostridium pasteurianum DSM 525 = ATCC 6013]